MAKYDRCDPDWRVAKLTRVGHHLWRLRRKSGLPVAEREAVDAALETIWAAKRELKAEITAQKKSRWQIAKADGLFTRSAATCVPQTELKAISEAV